MSEDNKRIEISPDFFDPDTCKRIAQMLNQSLWEREANQDPELERAFAEFRFAQEVKSIIADCVKFQEIIVALNKVDALKTHPQVMVEYANEAAIVNAKFKKCIKDAHESGILTDKEHAEFTTMYKVFEIGITLVQLFDARKESDDGSEDKDQN